MSSARPRSRCGRRAAPRRWSRPASWRRAPRCSSRRRSNSSCRAPGRRRPPSAARCATTWPGWCRRWTDYPLWCLEQATSRGFPLALLPDGPMRGPDRAGAAAAGGRLRARPPALRRRLRPLVGVARRPSLGSRPTRRSSCCARAMPARRCPKQAMIDAAEVHRATPPTIPGTSRRTSPRRRTGSTCWRWPDKGPPGRGAGAWRSRSTSLPTPLAKAQLGRGAGAGARPAARGGGVRRRAGGAGTQVVGVRLRHRAARPGGDRGAAEGERPAAGDRLERLLAVDAGRRPVGRHAVARRSRRGRRRPAAVLGRDGTPARIALDGQDLPPAPVVSVALTGPATGAQPGGQAGVAGGVGHRRPGDGAAGGARRRCGSPASSRRWTGSRSISIT